MRVLFVLILTGLSLGWGGEARAHAVLLATIPPDRSIVADAPHTITLRFNENVRPIAVQVRDGDGALIPIDIAVIDREVRIHPHGALRAAGYILSYRVTSADSHPVAGSILFAVGTAPPGWFAPPRLVVTSSEWDWASAVNRALFLAAALIALGAVLYGFAVRVDPPPRALLLSATAIALAASVASIYLQGGLLLDAADARPWDGEVWRVGLSSTRAMASFVAIFGLATLGVGQFVPPVWRTPMNAFAALCVVANFALSGHAATAEPRWIAIPTLLLHVVVVAFWLGSLVPLLLALREQRGRRWVIFQRFSEIAVLAVPQLVVAGIVLAVLQIQRFDALFGSVYSLTFTVKLLLVSLLFTLAMINRWILMPEMAENVPGHANRFRVTIFAELGLGFAILCVTAFLSQGVPPRSLVAQQDAVIEAARGAGQTMLIAASDRKALLMVTPVRPGRNTIRVRVFDADDGVVDPLEVALELSNPRAGIEPIHRVTASIDDGFFEYAGPDFAIAGRWVVRIEALIGDFEKSFFETEIIVE